MTIKKLPEIPTTWLVGMLLVGLIILRCFGIDTWVTAALGILIGYLTGVKMEQVRNK